MNDFINKEKEKEIINQVLDFLYCDIPSIPISEYLEDEIKNINKNYKDIGLKDINGKSIYADSSIVEFTNDNNKKQYQGYFKYDLYHQRMFFWFLCCVRDNKSFGYLGEGLDRVEYLPCAMTNFKIIDTIQENKLGLIK